MQNLPNKPARRTIICGIAALALILGGVLAWRLISGSVRTGDLEAFLDKAVGGGRVHFYALEVTDRREDESGLHLTVAARARAPGPLYSKLATEDYLQRTFQLDPEQTADAQRLLADKVQQQKPGNAGAAPFPPDPYRTTILQLTSPADATFSFQGVVDAHRSAGAWTFALGSGGFDGGSPQGDARSTFGDQSFAAGDASDDARLHGLVSDFQAFAGRLALVRRNAEAAHAAVLERRRTTILAEIAPGRVFRGLAFEDGEQQGTPLYLEVVALSTDNELTVLLRNECGWQNERTFQGSWSADENLENVTLNLASPPDQAVRNGGPFLENTQNWTFALRIDSHGGLSEKNRLFQYRFQPVNPEQVAALRARLEMEFEGAMAATEPGLLYSGTAVSRASGSSEPILLRFTGRSEGGVSLDARIESTTRSWKRTLHGTIFTNSRRSGGEPVRLASPASDAAEDAPADSVLGDKDDLDIHLGTEGRRLVGEDGQFTYRLAAAVEADLQRLEADRAERARRFMGVFRAGIAYDGSMREEQGFVTHARLEITRVDRQTGAIAARINSLAQLNAHREFLGTCDPSGSSVVLGATSRGAYVTDGSFELPFLTAPAASTLHLALNGNVIAGRIEGDPHWVIEFPVGAFTSAATEGPDPRSPAADGSVFPAFPKAAGAYLLKGDGWLPMPRNQGHVVEEEAPKESQELRLPTNLVAAVTQSVDGIASMAKSKKEKIPYLEFDGKDPRPEAVGQAIIILFVGPEPQGKPPLELIPAETTKEGQRRVELEKGSTDRIRFGERRLAAYVRQVAPGAILLTTTTAPAPGAYVLNADVGYEMTQQ